jgi:alpha-galactosidase
MANAALLSVLCLSSLDGPKPPPSYQEWAATPPMGWNSWDAYGTAVREEDVKANADYMAKNLAQHGWQYVVVDIQWYRRLEDCRGDASADARRCRPDEQRLLPRLAW